MLRFGHSGDRVRGVDGAARIAALSPRATVETLTWWEAMGKRSVPLSGIRADVQARLACYKQDWVGGVDSGYRFVDSGGFLHSVDSLSHLAR